MTTLTDVLYLNAQGNVDAVFVFQITGSLNFNANASVVLQNGAQAKNVFWQVPGVISMANNAVFKGTVVGSAAINISAGTTLVGRALTTGGAVNTNAIAVSIPSVCDMTIPVTWLYITAKPVDNDVLVEWATADEVNNRYFIIEKSKDGKVFQAIETVNTLGNLVKGEHRYAFTDKEPFSIAYYRISQVDNGGEQKRYSRTVQVSMSQGFKVRHSVRVNSIYVETSGASSGTGSIELYNIDDIKRPSILYSSINPVPDDAPDVSI